MTSTRDKLRGGYYTPPSVADFVCRWAIDSIDNTVLEPSCGDGVFIAAATRELSQLGATETKTAKNVIGIELCHSEVDKARSKGGTILEGDFFSLCSSELSGSKFDVIVGNPPFIRYQDFREEFRESAFALMKSYGFHPNRLTNIWLPFLIVCSHLLSENGRLGMVIPAELFQVKYAAETRSYLMRAFESVTLITFSELLFPDAQQEVILLLCEKSLRSGSGIRFVETKNAASLDNIDPQSLRQLSPKRSSRNP